MMNRITILTLLYFGLMPFLTAQNYPVVLPQDGGSFESHQHQTGPCLTPTDREQIKKRLRKNIEQLKKEGKLPHSPEKSNLIVNFDWPLAAAPAFEWDSYYTISNYVDQNPNSGLLDYNCGMRTYDGHQGIDFATWPFSWYLYENDLVEVIAGASGTIIDKQDGNEDDHCSFLGNWNAVYIQHSDGSIAWYGHLKTNSLTSKSIGQTVAQGEYLGLVASSGFSTGPHLHLEVYEGLPYSFGNLIDPYQGSCNSFNSDSWWTNQEPYRDRNVNALLTHDAPPEMGCPTINENPNFSNTFFPGETLYTAVYFRDETLGDVANFRIRRPDNSIWENFSHTSDDSYNGSYWWWPWTLPTNGPFGTWTVEVDYDGQTTVHEFQYGISSGNPCYVETASDICESVDIPTESCVNSSASYQAGDTPHFWCYLFGIDDFYRARVLWYDPNGNLYAEDISQFTNTNSGNHWFYFPQTVNIPGNWNVEYYIENQIGESCLMNALSFTVTGSAISWCDEATPINCGDFLSNQTTIGQSNLIDFYPTCGTNDFFGPDRIYSLTLNSTTNLQVSMEILTPNLDLDIFLIDGDCNEVICYNGGGTDNSINNFEGFSGDVAAGNYFIVVDANEANWAGNFNLDVTCGELDCGEVIPIGCNVPTSGNNVNGINNASVYTFPNLSSINVSNTSPEVIYSFTPEISETVLISLTNLSANLELFLLSECDKDAGLQESSNAGTQPEVISYVVTAGVTYYIVVDGFNGAVSSFTLQVEGSCNNNSCSLDPQPGWVFPETEALIAEANYCALNPGGAFSVETIYLQIDGEDFIVIVVAGVPHFYDCDGNLVCSDTNCSSLYLDALNNPITTVIADYFCNNASCDLTAEEILCLPSIQNYLIINSDFDCIECPYEIFTGSYNGQAVIAITPPACGSDAIGEVMDCEGNTICTVGGISGGDCPSGIFDFIENVTPIWDCSEMLPNCNDDETNIYFVDNTSTLAFDCETAIIDIENIISGNEGTLDVQDVVYSFWLSQDQVFDTNTDYFIDNIIIPFIGANTTVSFDATFDLNNYFIPFGNYFMFIQIDPNNLIDETNESDNLGIWEIYPIEYTDDCNGNDTNIYFVDDTGFLSYDCETTIIDIESLVIGNEGTQDVLDVILGFWLSQDQVFDTNTDYFIDSYFFPFIGANTTAAISPTFDLSNYNIPFGNYYLFLEIDPNNIIDETDETDNVGIWESPLIEYMEDCNTMPPITPTMCGDSTFGDLQFILNPIIATNGNSAQIPVTVQNFGDSLQLFFYTLTIADGSVFVPTGIVDAALVVSNWSVIGNEIEISWENSNQPALADDTVIFYIEGDIVGSEGTCSDVDFTDNLTGSIEVYAINSNLQLVEIIAGYTAANVCAVNETTGLSCATPLEILCSSVTPGNSENGTSNFDSYGCANNFLNGNEAVHSINIAGPQDVIFTLSGLSADLELIILDECQPENCIAYSFRSGNSAESILLENLNGEYFVIIDGYSDTNSGYILSVDCPNELPSGNLDCDNTLPIGCDETVVGSTCDGENNVVSYCSNNQSGYQSGQEVVYSFTLTESRWVTFTLSDFTDDLDMFLLPACDTEECIFAFNNSGLTEETTQLLLFPGDYFLVVDGFNGAASTFRLTTSCSTPNGEPEQEFDCDDTPVISCSASPISGNNGNGNDDVDSHCGSYNTGPELIYEFVLENQSNVELLLSDMTQNLNLFIYDECSVASNCIASGTKDGLLNEQIMLLDMAAGTYFIIIDGYDEAVSDFILTIECQLMEVIKAGEIYTETFIPLEDTDVSCSDDVIVLNSTTDASGYYEFLPATGGLNYTVNPIRDGNDKDGINFLDKSLLVLYIQNSPAVVFSNYQKIAADVNADGCIAVDDALILADIASASPNSNSEFGNVNSWRFVPADFDLDNSPTTCTNPFINNPKFHVPGFEEFIYLPNLLQNRYDLDFIGVKMGDLNNDWMPGPPQITNGFNTPETVLFHLPNMAFKAGEEKEITLTGISAASLVALEITLQYATEDLVITDITHNLPDGTVEFDQYPTSENAATNSIYWSWISGNNLSVNLAELPVNLTITVQAKKELTNLQNHLWAKPNGKDCMAVLSDLTTQPISLSHDLLNANENRNSLETKLGIFPNPFSTTTTLQFSLSEKADFTLNIYNVLGERVAQKAIIGKTGLNQILLDSRNFPQKGMYYVVLTNERQRIYGTLLFQ